MRHRAEVVAHLQVPTGELLTLLVNLDDDVAEALLDVRDERLGEGFGKGLADDRPEAAGAARGGERRLGLPHLAALDPGRKAGDPVQRLPRIVVYDALRD